MNTYSQIEKLFNDKEISEETLYKLALFKQELNNFKQELNKHFIKLGNSASPLASKVNFGMLAALTLGTLAASRLFEYGDVAIKNWASKLEADKNYDKMLEHHPDLRNEDQEKVRAFYNTLNNFAPTLAKDPLTSGAYVKRSLRFEAEGGPSYDVVKSLVGVEKDLGSMKKSITAQELENAFVKKIVDVMAGSYIISPSSLDTLKEQETDLRIKALRKQLEENK